MKRLIRRLFEKLGYEIKNIVDIDDAVAYNEASGVEAFYSDPVKVDLYLKFEVQNILENNMAELSRKKIDLNGKCVLDVSCGTGHFLKAIKETFPTARLQGTEYVESVMKIAAQTMPDAKILKLNIETQKLDSQFDFVSCMQVLEHLKYPKKALQNLMEMVAFKGLLFVAVPDGRIDTFPGHIFFWGIDSWKLLLQETFPSYDIEVGYMSDKQSLFAWIQKS